MISAHIIPDQPSCPLEERFSIPKSCQEGCPCVFNVRGHSKCTQSTVKRTNSFWRSLQVGFEWSYVHTLGWETKPEVQTSFFLVMRGRVGFHVKLIRSSKVSLAFCEHLRWPPNGNLPVRPAAAQKTSGDLPIITVQEVSHQATHSCCASINAHPLTGKSLCWHLAAIGLASATSQLDRNAWQRIATYKSGSKQTWRRIFFVWNHIEKAQTDRTPAQLPLAVQLQPGFFVFFLQVQIPCYILSSCATSQVRRAVSLSVVPVQHGCLEEDPSRPTISLPWAVLCVVDSF